MAKTLSMSQIEMYLGMLRNKFYQITTAANLKQAELRRAAEKKVMQNLGLDAIIAHHEKFKSKKTNVQKQLDLLRQAFELTPKVLALKKKISQIDVETKHFEATGLGPYLTASDSIKNIGKYDSDRKKTIRPTDPEFHKLVQDELMLIYKKNGGSPETLTNQIHDRMTDSIKLAGAITEVQAVFVLLNDMLDKSSKDLNK